MRLIDVSVLKEWVENWFTKNRLYHPYAKNNNIPITELYDILEQMPSAVPEPQWIPCSERLPEDMQFVLLTVRRLKNEYNHEPFISVGYIGWNQQHWWCAHDGDCEISKVEVIAWMPLPEPYVEKENR